MPQALPSSSFEKKIKFLANALFAYFSSILLHSTLGTCNTIGVTREIEKEHETQGRQSYWRT